jgi:hypothetical protein
MERDQVFAARWVLGGIPVVNLKTLRARGILEKVRSSRGGHRAYCRIMGPMLSAVVDRVAIA